MKNIVKLLCGALFMGTALTACSPEEYEGAVAGGEPVVTDYEDAIKVYVDQETNTAHFVFDQHRQGVTPVWIINGERYSSSFSDSAYYRKAGDYAVEVKVKTRHGISNGSIVKSFHIDKTKMNGFGGFDAESKYNLWRQATINEPTFYYAPGWSQIANPTYSKAGYDYVNLSLPQATADQWQAQCFFQTTNLATSAGKQYDFSVILTSNVDVNQVTVQVGQDGVGTMFNERIDLKAGEPICFWRTAVAGINASNVRLVLDLGGNPAGTVINIESIVLKDHADDDGTVVP